MLKCIYHAFRLVEGGLGPWLGCGQLARAHAVMTKLIHRDKVLGIAIPIICELAL